MIFTPVGTMSLLPYLHSLSIAGRHGERYIHGASPVVLRAYKEAALGPA